LVCERGDDPYFFIKYEVETIYKMLGYPIPRLVKNITFDKLSVERKKEETACKICKGLHIIKTEHLKSLLYVCDSWGEHYC